MIGKLFKRLIMCLPPAVRYVLTLIAFWPTALLARVLAWMFPHWRRVWDRVDEHVILGAAPFLRRELEALYHKERVRGIVNMCREWDWHRRWYSRNGFVQLHLPTIDFDTPAFEDCLAGAQFIHEHAQRGETVYVHCKAGRGRSTTVVLAYLVLYKHMTPLQADAHVRRARAHISSRWDTDSIRRVHEVAQRHADAVRAGRDVLEAVRALQAQRTQLPSRSHAQADSAAAAHSLHSGERQALR